MNDDEYNQAIYAVFTLALRVLQIANNIQISGRDDKT